MDTHEFNLRSYLANDHTSVNFIDCASKLLLATRSILFTCVLDALFTVFVNVEVNSDVCFSVILEGDCLFNGRRIL